MIEIRLPQAGMGMTDGTILQWRKIEGERVRKGEILCDIETAKTTVEMESPESGVLTRILIPIGRNVAVDTVVALMEQEGAAAGTATTAATALSSASPSATPGAVPASSGTLPSVQVRS